MAFAKFNQCNPCCNCVFDVSYTSGGGPLVGVTITARDINGSGVGSCVTTASGCSIAIRHPGTYYIHNDYCNTTQQVVIAKCGNDVNVIIPCIHLNVEAHSACFFDVPLTRFTFSGPASYEAEASGNVLIGVLPFPQLAAQVTMPCPLPSGIYAVTVEDVEGNHYPKTTNVDLYCQLPFPRTSIYMIKKWGYRRAPRMLTAAGCPAPGITISDSDGHSATTDSNGMICDVWKYDFPDEDPTVENSFTTLHVTKGGYIDPCGPDGCVQSKPRCSPERTCDDGSIATPEFDVLRPAGMWGSPTDDCLETIPETLSVTVSGFTVNGGNSATVTRDFGVGFPYNYGGGAPPDAPLFIKVLVGVYPGCRKDIATGGSIGPFIRVQGDESLFPFGSNSLQITGTSACTTMFTVIEINSITGLPTGRSATVSAT